MANNAISMQKTRQVLRLRSQGKGIKAISSLVSIARNTVKKYHSRLEASGVDLESALSLSDMDLQSLLQEKPVVPISTRHEILYSLLPIYCKRLKRKGVTREMLHQEYKTKYPDGYSRSGFCRHMRDYQYIHASVMHLEHKAGDKLYIDFAGKKLSIVDIDTGEIVPVEVVATPANNEFQYYRSENIAIGKEPLSDESCLILTARREDYGNRAFTSGRLNSLQKVAFRYGRLDARIKLPKTDGGLWPAFWMKGNDNATVPWPRCGELDILEMGHVDGMKKGIPENYIGAACHWGPSSTNYKSIGNKFTSSYSLQDDDFHLYTLIWDKDSVKLYLDIDKYQQSQPYFTFHYSVAGNNAAEYFQKEYFILFNLAVGGGYTGIRFPKDNPSKITALSNKGDEAKMYVDYVRIYQKNEEDEILIIP